MRPEILYYLFSPVTRLKGVGVSVAEALSRVLPGEGRPLVRDVLFHLPTGLIDRRRSWPLREAPDGETGTFIVKVEAHQPPPRGRFGGRKPYKVLCANETGELTLVFFNAREDYLKQALPVGQARVVSGRVEHFDYRLQMTHPDIIAPPSQLKEVQRVEPVYPLTAGLTNKRLTGIIQQAMADAPALPEWLGDVRGRPSWREALIRAHAPQSEADLLPDAPARERLAYDEMLAYQLHVALLRSRMQEKPGRIMQPGTLRGALLKRLPFALTDGQLAALSEIDADMASGRRMARLLQGDVGSGKTVVALLAALTAVEGGAQAAIMAPTELIAQQHARTMADFLKDMDVRVALLTGSSRGREAALAAIASGEAQIVVGTHALFQEKVSFADLGLIVVDEQHRFGVGQRAALSAKGSAPHLLQMTATPIPRSLTMTLYGDMDCSLLTEKPPGRQPIATRVVPLSRAGELMERLEAALARGEKAYWICPLVEDDGALLKDDVAAAQARFTEFKARFGAQVGMAHGRMKAEERQAALARFAEGEARLLVATTVVEVGVDVPDATIIIVEQAERFGLSQLHQLRGRVGRGEKPSFCVLLYSDRAGEEAAQRLSALRASEDGFHIAEQDLAARGGGDLLGTRQSGLPRFRFIDLRTQQKLIVEARKEALVALGNGLTEPLGILMQLFGYDAPEE